MDKMPNAEQGMSDAKVDSITTKSQTTKFSSANFQKKLSSIYTIWRNQRLEGKQCRSQ